MANRAWVCKVVDASLVVSGKYQGGGEQIVKDGLGVGNVNDAGVFRDFGDEGPRVKVVGDGHAEAKNERIGVYLQKLGNL